MAAVFINRIGRAVPPHAVHRKFVEVAPHFLANERDRQLFRRMADRCQIGRRYSCLPPSSELHKIDTDGFYPFDAFPDTAQRMERYEREALPLDAAIPHPSVHFAVGIARDRETE